MAGGDYTQPVIIVGGTVTLGGVATITNAVSHNLVEGDLIEIIDIAGSAPAGPVIGDQYYVASTSVTTKTITAVSASTTTVTVTVTGHGLIVGEEITVSGLTQASGSSINGTFIITATAANTISYVVAIAPTSVALGTTPQLTIRNKFTIYVDWPDHSSSHTITYTKPQSSGGGFMHLPGAPWGTYFQRRLFVPYYYDQSGTGTVTFTDRNIRDEVAISDILDENTYDQIYNPVSYTHLTLPTKRIV